MLKVKRNGKWIDICGGAPSTDSRVGSLFTGATMPLTFKGNANSYENEYTYSSVQNITITGLSNIATITGNGSGNVVVKFDVTSSEDKIIPFLITVGDVDFQGRFFYYGKDVASGNCLAVCKLIAPDVGEVGELGVNYDIVKSSSYPLFLSDTTSWNGCYSHQIESFIFANKSTSISDYFLSSCHSFNQPLTLPSGVTSIGSNFLQYCYSFNQPLTLPSGVTSIRDYFLRSCYSFNQPLTLPSGVTSIGNYFLSNCYSFNQPLTLPSGVTSIGNYFLSSCYSFKQPLTLPSGVTSIGSNFLQYGHSFNQPLTLPSGVTSISNYFLSNCYSFNQPLTLPSGVTSIGNYFLSNCYSFNQPLTLPSGVTSIGNYFLSSCYSFKQPLTLPSGVTSIGNYFLSNCYSFNQPLTLPSGVTSIRDYFLSNCYSLTRLEYNASVYPTDNSSLSQNINTKTSSSGTGIKITGTNAEGLKSALPNKTSSPFRKLV